MLEEIYITVNKFGFNFSLNNEFKKNLMNPEFLNFFVEDRPSTTGFVDNHKSYSQVVQETGDAFPSALISNNRAVFNGVYEKRGFRVIRCFDATFRKCEVIAFNFEIETTRYCELFYLDVSLESIIDDNKPRIETLPQPKYLAILGRDFKL